MYSIRWFSHSGHKQYLLIGNMDSVMHIAHRLEYEKTYFKIADVAGPVLNQNALGCGGFYYWLQPDNIFSPLNSAKHKDIVPCISY